MRCGNFFFFIRGFSFKNWLNKMPIKYFIYFNNSNTITNYILIIYEQSNLDHVVGLVAQTRVSSGNRADDHHANSLAHLPLSYQGAP